MLLLGTTCIEKTELCGPGSSSENPTNQIRNDLFFIVPIQAPKTSKNQHFPRPSGPGLLIRCLYEAFLPAAAEAADARRAPSWRAFGRSDGSRSCSSNEGLQRLMLQEMDSWAVWKVLKERFKPFQIFLGRLSNWEVLMPF